MMQDLKSDDKGSGLQIPISMYKTLIILSLSFLLSCSNFNRPLEGKVQTLNMEYISWACDCANWASVEDLNDYKDLDSLAARCVFVEPATPSLQLPDTTGYNGDQVEFTGQFYIGKGYPAGYSGSEEPVEKAMVFRYTAYKIIESKYRAFREAEH